MKWFVIALLFSSVVSARSPELLKCLGTEEKNFHLKKDIGPSYDLNQKMIAEILQVPNATIDQQSLKEICGAKGKESWKLLQLSLTKGKKIFVISESLEGMQMDMTNGMIDDYLEATREILLNLIAQIQALAPTPDCLTQEIPTLGLFFQDLKYLQEEVDTAKLFKGRDEKIFNALRSYPKAIKRCQERLKKKLKSASTVKPKKS
ncbi:MAG TPA: hypothetical protein VNJ08_15195 [Bacteriovoracaceae bacterium]|nr:hypothetical protein [Bacteriovoracaceae bacterium]